MTEKQVEQREKLLKDQLALGNWFEEDFRHKLGNKGYQDFIDQALDELLFWRQYKKDHYGK